MLAISPGAWRQLQEPSAFVCSGLSTHPICHQHSLGPSSKANIQLRHQGPAWRKQWLWQQPSLWELQPQTLHGRFISCPARSATAPPCPVTRPLLFEGTSGKGRNKDSLHYVPKSVPAATLPALLCILGPWPLDHLHSRHSSSKPQKTNRIKVCCPL